MSLMRVWPSNQLIDPMNPDPELIDIRDMAHHLSRINRYGGASELSVAQHVCEMTSHVLRTAIYTNGRVAEGHRLFAFECLMHDAAEYLLGDMIRPLKSTFLGDIFKPIEAHVDSVIRARYGVTNRYSDRVHELDVMMCATEQRDLFGGQGVNCLGDVKVHPWTMQHSASEFLRLFFLLEPSQKVQQGQVAA